MTTRLTCLKRYHLTVVSAKARTPFDVGPHFSSKLTVRWKRTSSYLPGKAQKTHKKGCCMGSMGYGVQPLTAMKVTWCVALGLPAKSRVAFFVVGRDGIGTPVLARFLFGASFHPSDSHTRSRAVRLGFETGERNRVRVRY